MRLEHICRKNSQMRRIGEFLIRGLGHYLPYWMALLLLGFPWLASMIEEPKTPSPDSVRSVAGSRELNVAADVSFALISFWIWAFTTSSYGGNSIRSAGEKKYSSHGGQALRRAESAQILFFSVITSLIYLATVIPRCHPVAGRCALIATIFPFVVLRLPP